MCEHTLDKFYEVFILPRRIIIPTVMCSVLQNMVTLSVILLRCEDCYWETFINNVAQLGGRGLGGAERKIHRDSSINFRRSLMSKFFAANLCNKVGQNVEWAKIAYEK